MFDLHFIQDDVLRLLRKQRIARAPGRLHAWRQFRGEASYAWSLVLSEKEIVSFAALQWIVIALVYYLWVQIVGWIPMEVWESDAKREGILLNLALLGWSFACVALAAFPIGVLTGCIGAAHLLRRHDLPCTVAGCLALVWPQAGSLWAFHTADGWLTVEQIVERLPRKNRRRLSAAARAASELAYYGWKVGTVGMVPAIVAGHDLWTAATHSVALAKHRLSEVALLRAGYSAACWIVAIAAYVAAFGIVAALSGVLDTPHPLFTFYLVMGVPLLAAAGAVTIVLRPIFVIAACRLYADYAKEEPGALSLPAPSQLRTAVFGISSLALLLGAVFLYREEIGLMWILRAGS
jgi:hypothetical protein